MAIAGNRHGAFRFWGLGILFVLFSAGAAFSYLHSMEYGMVAGDLIGLRGREGDVALARRCAVYWLIASAGCLGFSSIAGALTAPVYEFTGAVPPIARLVIASVISFVLAMFIGLMSFWIVTASHHSIIQ